MTASNRSHLSLGSTARWIAGLRALETVREDRLFADSWAAALAGEEGLEWAREHAGVSSLVIIVRTRFFDDFLLRKVISEGVRQVVLLAAGMDTRAFRLEWPGNTRVFELDQPAVLAEKERVLSSAGARPACDRRVVGVDLSGIWRDSLLGVGFEPGKPAVWLAEGILFYLPDDGIAALLDDVTALSAPGSLLAFDIINRETLTSHYTREWVEMQARADAPWIGSIDDPVGFLMARGWDAVLTQPGEQDASYGRWTLPVLSRVLPKMPRLWFATAVRFVSPVGPPELP